LHGSQEGQGADVVESPAWEGRSRRLVFFVRGPADGV